MLFLLLFVPLADAFFNKPPPSPRSPSSQFKNLIFEIADAKSLPEVSNFFVDAFWLGSTTFEKVELSPSDRRQLTQSTIDDLGPRYGIQSNDKRPTMMGGRRGFPSKSLFETRLIVAREPGGAIVGCAGIEAAFYDPNQGQVVRSFVADRLVRDQLDTMEEREAEVAAELYARSGIGDLAKAIIGEKFNPLLKPFLKKITPCSLLANFAVAPSYRRSGLGRVLCDQCVRCSVDEWKIDEVALQVEEVNKPAVALYRSAGYKEMFRSEDQIAIRLQPSKSKPTPFDNLPGFLSTLAPENEKLLKEVPAPILTMSKKVS